MKKLVMIKVAEELNNFFKTVVASLDIHGNLYTVENVENMNDPVEKAIKNLNLIQVFCLSKIKLAKTFLKFYFILIFCFYFLFYHNITNKYIFNKFKKISF